VSCVIASLETIPASEVRRVLFRIAPDTMRDVRRICNGMERLAGEADRAAYCSEEVASGVCYCTIGFAGVSE